MVFGVRYVYCYPVPLGPDMGGRKRDSENPRTTILIKLLPVKSLPAPKQGTRVEFERIAQTTSVQDYRV